MDVQNISSTKCYGRLLKKSADFFAATAQVYSFALSTPADDNCFCSEDEVSSFSSASRNSVLLLGSISSAASPATSGSDDTFVVMIGPPPAIACATEKPNPSYSEG